MIVCVGGQDGVNIYEVGDRMSKKGWNLNSLQSPPGIHLCVTLRHVGKHEAFLTDLREVRLFLLLSGWCQAVLRWWLLLFRGRDILSRMYVCMYVRLVCVKAVVKEDQ